MRFPVNFAKFQRTPSFTEHLRWLLLNRFIDFSAKSCWAVEYNDSVIIHIIDTKYSRMDQIKFVEDSL